MRYLLIIIVSAFLGLFLTEIYLRSTKTTQFSEKMELINKDVEKFHVWGDFKEAKRLVPFAKFRHTRSVNGKEIFSVTYEIDEFGRRKTLTSSSKTSHAIFAGCSFTFGYGLNNGDTLPSIFSKISSYNPYNYGVNSYGTYNILAAFSERDLTKEVKEQEGVMYYIYIDAHIKRSYGVNFYQYYFENFPIYTLEDGQLKYTGTVEERYPFSSKVVPVLLNFSIFRRLFNWEHKGWLYRRNEADDWSWAHAIKEIKSVYLSQFPKSRFYFVVFPATPFDKDLRKKLESLDVDIIEFPLEEISFLKNSVNYIDVDYESHPSGRFNKKLADALIKATP